jgi:hypothetical protein
VPASAAAVAAGASASFKELELIIKLLVLDILLHQVIYHSFNQRNENSRSSKLMTTNCNYRTVQNLVVLAIAAAAKVVRSPTLEKKNLYKINVKLHALLRK